MTNLAKAVIFCSALLASAVLIAQQSDVAVLYGTGSVFLNGAQVSNSAAVSGRDVIQTKENGAANINTPGSSAVIESNSIVRYQPDGFALDRGNISVATGKGASVFVRDFKITPAADGWTEFYVTRTNGGIGIIARKNPVTVTCGGSSTNVNEGQQISRDDAANCGLITKAKGAPAAAKGPLITQGRAEVGALAAGGLLAGWSIALHDDKPLSPHVP